VKERQRERYRERGNKETEIERQREKKTESEREKALMHKLQLLFRCKNIQHILPNRLYSLNTTREIV
jgi:hypothetical protein